MLQCKFPIGQLVEPRLGERAKIVIFSVTEDEDKALKHPHMFRAAGVAMLNKADLLPHIEFSMTAVHENIRVNPDALILEASARNEKGLDTWYRWIREQAVAARELVSR